MTDYFSQIKGGFRVHVEEDGFTGVRFCLARFGEDADNVLETVLAREQWRRRFRACSVVQPTAALLAQSYARNAHLAAALQSVTIEPSSYSEMQWKASRRPARRGLAYATPAQEAKGGVK